MWTYVCSGMFLLGGVERGAVVAVAWGLRIVHHIGNDNHVGGKQCGDTALRNKGALCGVAKFCLVGTQQYMLNECGYFHQWHARAARAAQGYQFINFYSGFRCSLNSNLSCRWSGISCFHLLKFKQFGYKEISPNKIWPHLPGVYVSQVLVLQCSSFRYTFCVCELRDMRALTVAYLPHISWTFWRVFFLINF